GARRFEPVDTIAGLDHLVAFVAQQRDDELAVARVVVNYENSGHEPLLRSNVDVFGQRKVEGGALANLRFGPDTPSVSRHDASHLGEPHADSAERIRGVHALKR